MKKYLAFLLVLVMILSVSLVACSKKNQEPADDDDDGWGNGGNNTSSTESIDENDGNNDNGDGNTPSNNDWREASGKVYVAMNDVNLRYQANANSGVYKKVNQKTELDRLETNGTYDKVSFEGQTIKIEKLQKL